MALEMKRHYQNFELSPPITRMRKNPCRGRAASTRDIRGDLVDEERGGQLDTRGELASREWLVSLFLLEDRRSAHGIPERWSRGEEGRGRGDVKEGGWDWII